MNQTCSQSCVQICARQTMVSPAVWAPVPASAFRIGFHECKQEGIVENLGALEQYREFTETCKVFEGHTGPSSVMEPKEMDSLCELVWHPAVAPPLEDLLYYWGLRFHGTWQAIDNAHQKAEKSQHFSKSWGKWCAYHTQCQNEWLNHKKSE